MSADEYSAQLAQAISGRSGFDPKDLTIEALSHENQVKDATLKYLLLNKAGRVLAFILMANDDYPDAVKLAAQSAQRASQIVGEDLANLIVLPSFEGNLDKNTFAVFPYYHPLRLTKLSRVIARRTLVVKVLEWLEKVAIKTTRQIPDEHLQNSVAVPLQWIASCPQIHEAIRADALAAIKSMEKSEWLPKCVFSHNDLWAGNVLMQPKSDASLEVALATFGLGEPRIIDWLSSSEEGIPYYDLINYANSMGYPLKKISSLVNSTQQQTDSDYNSGYFDLLAGFARLGMNRGEFPLDRYVLLLEQIVKSYHKL